MSNRNIVLVTGASSGIGKEVSKKLCQEGYEVILTSRTKDKLKLCIGCKVMVNWNIDIEKGIVNGTTGTVVNLDKDSILIKITNSSRVYKVKYVNIKDENTGLILQTIMPLQLAWGITIHKSQGATIDYLLTDLGLDNFKKIINEFDKKALKNISINDTSRMRRIWEVYYSTGKPLSKWVKDKHQFFLKDINYNLFLFTPNRQDIYKRVDTSFQLC